MSIVTARPAEGEVLLDRLLEEGVAVAHECGGKLACSSCQIIVREGAERLSAASEDELDMLERAAVEDPNARLACQAVSKGGEILVEVPDPAIPARALGSQAGAPAPV
ncbi:MAG TPA: 2Fe-2S iron-sulfur cluster-binding protein, partial [Burkholderiales bacterium]|nr:2Fe-2S iron-sulfur cluster-binding protein [Burkholderiales bacterium]